VDDIRLTGLIAEVQELISRELAVKLILCFSGQHKIYIPKQQKGKSWQALVAAVGSEDANQLHYYYQGAWLFISKQSKTLKAVRKKEFKRLMNLGFTPENIGQHLKLSRASAYRIAKELQDQRSGAYHQLTLKVLP
jgi:hypothetical protein